MATPVLITTLAMILQQFINGGANVLTQVAVDGSTPCKPQLFALIRDTGASMVLLAAARLIYGGEVFWPARKHVLRLAAIGICGIWGGQLLGAMAISKIGAVIFSVMQPSQPVLTLIIAVCIGMEGLVLWPGCALGAAAKRQRRRKNKYGREQASSSLSSASSLYDEDSAQSSSGRNAESRAILHSWLKVLGMVLTISGAVVIALLDPNKKAGSSGTSVGVGFILTFIECFLGAFYGIFQKGLLDSYPAAVVCAWGYALGTTAIVFTIAFFAVLSAAGAYDGTSAAGLESVMPDPLAPGFWHVPMNAVPSLVYAIILQSALGYYIMSWVNARSSPFFVTIFYPLNFPATALLGWLFLPGHSISPVVLIGGGMISVGLYAVVFAQSRSPPPAPATDTAAIDAMHTGGLHSGTTPLLQESSSSDSEEQGAAAAHRSNNLNRAAEQALRQVAAAGEATTRREGGGGVIASSSSSSSQQTAAFCSSPQQGASSPRDSSSTDDESWTKIPA